MQRILYGHRGAPAELPENSIASFARALEVGANALEMDVRLTRDGQVVVFHDETADRVAGVHCRIADASWEEVRSWDLGRGWVAGDGSHPYEGQGYHPPTFEEVMDSFPGVLLNVDAKEPRVVEPLVRVVRRQAAEDRVRLASFSEGILRQVRALGWRGRLGLGPRSIMALRLSPVLLLRLLRWFRLLGGDAVQIPVRHGLLRLDTPVLIDRAHALGLRVDYWTIDSPAEAQRLYRAGADGIVSNDPAKLAAIR